jgi:hypothetical protein
MYTPRYAIGVILLLLFLSHVWLGITTTARQKKNKKNMSKRSIKWTGQGTLMINLQRQILVFGFNHGA